MTKIYCKVLPVKIPPDFWTAERLSILRTYFRRKNYMYLEQVLETTQYQIKKKALELGMVKSRMGKKPCRNCGDFYFGNANKKDGEKW